MRRQIRFAMPRLWLSSVSVAIGVAASEASGQGVVYVDQYATGPVHDGASWCNAFLYLQDAIGGATAGTTIRVADGTYKPDQGVEQTSGDRNATFHLITGVALEGGYAGCGAPTPDAQDVALYETILSGDLFGNDVNGLNDHSRAENSYHVIDANGTNATAILAGFAIEGGNANGAAGFPASTGGGLALAGDAQIRNCAFRNNRAWSAGGAIYIGHGSSPKFDNCTLQDNGIGGFGGAGGAIAASGASTSFARCKFIGNTTPGRGGALSNHEGNIVLNDCRFFGNESGGGGGIDSSGAHSELLLQGCAFMGNQAAGQNGAGGNGGAIYCAGNLSVRLINCVFSDNEASIVGGGQMWGGGAVYYLGGPPSTITITNCTFNGNVAVDGGGLGGGVFLAGSASINNSVFWNNVSSSTQASQIFDFGSSANVSYSLIEGGWSGSGTRNIAGDPLFLNVLGQDGILGTDDDNLRLSTGSPCIDIANNIVDTDDNAPNIQPLPVVDFDGSSRKVAVLSIWRIVDLGAFEFVDCNANDVTDPAEIALGTSPDCNRNVIPDECESLSNGDFDGDRLVTLNDLAWLTKCLFGPSVTPQPDPTNCTSTCLDAFDLDGDDDIDLNDIVVFQREFGSWP